MLSNQKNMSVEHLKRRFKHTSNGDISENNFIRKLLVGSGALIILTSIVSYTVVLWREDQLLKLHKQAVTVQMNNIEMKNKVEFARSLYNVQNKAETLTFLHKPEKVIEVDLKDSDITVKYNKKHCIVGERVVGGY